MQENTLSAAYTWYQANLITSCAIRPDLKLSARIEYFNDGDQAVIDALDPDGFEGGSAGLGLTYQVTAKSLLRFEGRQFFAAEDQFLTASGAPVQGMTWLITSFTAWF
jgi:hypothetical protein